MRHSSPDLQQTTVVITGASAGVGRAVALRFAQAGAKLALLARDAAALEDVKREAENLGATAMVVPIDVADANAVLEAYIDNQRNAKVEVTEIAGKPGAYRAIAFLRPHFQLDELTVSLRLVADLPQAAK